jgi:hypothetical protein
MVVTWIAVLVGPPALPQKHAPHQHLAAQTSSPFRTVRGKHLTLITDLPASPAVDQLPEIFDAAIPQWCTYFQVDLASTAGWQVRAYLMQQPDRFRAQGWLPDDLPPFLHGFQRGDEFWFYEQPTDYFRRHLLLHEGTHAFMHRILGTKMQPGWYFEGIAELLATHRFDGDQLTLNTIPDSKEDVPHWGRIRLIREAVAAGRLKSIAEIRELTARDFQSVEAYAWSWAAAAFLDGHPAWRNTYRGWANVLRKDSQRFETEVSRAMQQADPSSHHLAWQLFLHHLDYGYNVAEEAVRLGAIQESPGDGLMELQTTQGWQSTAWRLSAGQSYRIEASGRYVLDVDDPRWQSEADGITFRYHAGRPLGILLAAIQDPDEFGSDVSAMLAPIAVGASAELTPSDSGLLFLRINEMAGLLGDNQGTLTIRVTPLGPKDERISKEAGRHTD